jgi:hypothetical protein
MRERKIKEDYRSNTLLKAIKLSTEMRKGERELLK